MRGREEKVVDMEKLSRKKRGQSKSWDERTIKREKNKDGERERGKEMIELD